MKTNWIEQLSGRPLPDLLQHSADAAVLALLVWLLTTIFRRGLPAAWRHALWLLVFARLMIPGVPLVPVRPAPVTLAPSGEQAVGAPTPPARQAAAPGGDHVPPVQKAPSPSTSPAGDHIPGVKQTSLVESSPGTRVTVQKPFDWSCWLVAGWLTGVVALLAAGVIRSLFLHRRLIKNQSPAGAEVIASLHALARSMEFRRAPTVATCAAVRVPTLAGFWRPCILLPAGFAEGVPATQLRMVLGHEFAHWRRGDLWWQLFSSLLLVLHWFNPLLWLAHHRLRDEAEAAADAWMLARLEEGEARAYADTLIDLMSCLPRRQPAWRFGEAGHLGMAASAPGVRRRVIMIAEWIQGRRASVVTGVAAAAVLCGLGFIRAAEPQPAKAPAASAGTAASWRGTVRLRVVSAAGGASVPGVTAKVKAGAFESEAATDAAGAALLKLPPERSAATYGSIVVRLRAPGRVPMVLFWSLEQPSFSPPESLDLVMPEAVSVGGVVRDEQGAPVSGAKIALIMRGSNMGGATQEIFPDIWERRATTDAEGRWVFTEAPPELQRFSLAVEHPEVIPLKVHPSGDEAARFYAGKGETLVKRGTVITGRVVGADGKPLQAIITLGESGSDSTSYPEYKTEADGTFRIGNARKGMDEIATVTAKGHAPLLTRLAARADGAPLVFTLSAGRPLKVRVVNADGKPVAGVTAAADEWRGSSPQRNGPRVLNYRFTTDKEGRFTWTHAPEAAVSWDFFGADGYQDNRGVVLTPGETEALITLQRLTKIAGTVTDADTGAPIPAFRIVPADRREFPGWREAGHRSWVWWDSGTLDAGGGRFIYASDRGRRGDFRRVLRFSAEGYVPFMSEPIDELAGQVAWDIKLKKSPPMRLRILAPDGSPAPGAGMTWNCVRNGYVNIKAGGIPPQEGPGGNAVVHASDASGHAMVPAEAEEFGLVVVHDSGWASVPHEAVREGATLKLTPWAAMDLTLEGLPQTISSHLTTWFVPVVLEGRHLGMQVEMPKPSPEMQKVQETHLLPGLYKLQFMAGRLSTTPQLYRVRPGDVLKVDSGLLWQWCAPVLPLKLPPGAVASRVQPKLRVELDLPEFDLPLSEERKDMMKRLMNSRVFKRKRPDGSYPEALNLSELGAGSYRMTGELMGWRAGTPQDQPEVALATVDYRFTIPQSAVKTPEFTVESNTPHTQTLPKVTGLPLFELPPLEVR